MINHLYSMYMHVHVHIIALTLQQTVPYKAVAVCPLSTIQFTCVDKTLTLKLVIDTGMAGVFTTVLTDINGDTHINSYFSPENNIMSKLHWCKK